MGVTAAAIRQDLTRRGYPCSLTLDEVQGGIDAALRELNAYSPTVRYGSFQSIAGVQAYHVFDPASLSYVAGIESALSIEEVYYDPTGYSVTDNFSPFLWLLQGAFGGGGDVQNAFDYPSGMILFQEKLDAFRRQFGTQGYTLNGQPGQPGSTISLNSRVGTVGMALVAYTVGITLDDVAGLNLGWGRRLMMWVDHFCAETVALTLGETAGTDIAGVKITDAAMKLWERKSKATLDRAIQSQGGVYSGFAARA